MPYWNALNICPLRSYAPEARVNARTRVRASARRGAGARLTSKCFHRTGELRMRDKSCWHTSLMPLQRLRGRLFSTSWGRKDLAQPTREPHRIRQNSLASSPRALRELETMLCHLLRMLAPSIMVPFCRRIASQAALDVPMAAKIDKDSYMTAQLSRLIGLLAAKLDMRLAIAAMRAVGTLCNFGAESGWRTRCLTAAAAVAVGSTSVELKFFHAVTYVKLLHINGHDGFGCMIDVALTLLEGAAVKVGPPPVGRNDVIFITGQHSWVFNDSWPLTAAMAAMTAIADTSGDVMFRTSTQSSDTLRRKMVAAAVVQCATFRKKQSSLLLKWMRLRVLCLLELAVTQH